MRCIRCNSENVSSKTSQSVWIGYLIALAVIYYGFQSGEISSILITIGIGAAIVFFYKKWINIKYYCNDCSKNWTDGGFD
ncbi:hypothetical protein GCM10010831_16190 [Psychroflexus salis]|uniref:Uncharacterized protein n=1 Tax=Psychroflexus salis TaxID=1526574 RepID=A0A916ZW64_9FLAO|nr:hypothetical protein GCM10010831_16190 [Psychroflexus salis]